ncbi:hypothetical protein COPEUT_02176 [Coprococcus eutactus ATCC 27759]|nr:hypothetical protein COPEUT_02176 [Coprococcus eutactus ATCC 27759]
MRYMAQIGMYYMNKYINTILILYCTFPFMLSATSY